MDEEPPNVGIIVYDGLNKAAYATFFVLFSYILDIPIG